MTNSSKHPDIAKDFLMFVANGPKLKELEDIMYEEVGWLPHEMMLLPAILMFMKEFPNIKVLQLSQKIMNCIHIQESLLRTKHSLSLQNVSLKFTKMRVSLMTMMVYARPFMKQQKKPMKF